MTRVKGGLRGDKAYLKTFKNGFSTVRDAIFR